MATRKRSSRDSAHHLPTDLVTIYHPDFLPKGSNPEDLTAVTSYEAYELVWAEKGFLLLEDHSAEPQATTPTTNQE